MTTPGAQNPAPLDAQDQRAIQNARNDHQVLAPCTADNPNGGFGVNQQAINDIHKRAADKAALATATSSNSHMRVDPAQVDDLAAFFEHEAETLLGRVQQVQYLSRVRPAGRDAVSKNSAMAFGQVGDGGSGAYLDNYRKLAEVFHNTAENLRASARQTRTNEQDNQHNLEGGIRA